MDAGTIRLAAQAALLLGLAPFLLASSCEPEIDPSLCTVKGTPGNDRGVNALRGTPEDDIICGFEGDDELFGEGGNDTLYGGAGADDLYGGDGDDWLYGGTGADVLKGQAGDDVLSGGGGADELRGDGGADYLIGGAGNDRLYGGESQDDWVSYLTSNGPVQVLLGIATGADGTDELHDIENVEGTAFDDTIVASGIVRGMGGSNVIVGTTVDYSWSAPVEVNLARPEQEPGSGLHGGHEDALYGVQDVIGSNGDDVLIGNDQPNRIWGGAGDDQLFGRGGADTLDGGEGDDFADGDNGNDTCIAESVVDCEN